MYLKRAESPLGRLDAVCRLAMINSVASRIMVVRLCSTGNRKWRLPSPARQSACQSLPRTCRTMCASVEGNEHCQQFGDDCHSDGSRVNRGTPRPHSTRQTRSEGNNREFKRNHKEEHIRSQQHLSALESAWLDDKGLQTRPVRHQHPRNLRDQRHHHLERDLVSNWSSADDKCVHLTVAASSAAGSHRHQSPHV